MTPRPYVFVNVAMTADGKIDSIRRKGAAISSSADKARVDQLRATSDAVMVGGRTLINEDPRLTIRSATLRRLRLDQGLEENPAKVGILSVANIDLQGRFVTSGPARRLIYTTLRTPSETLTRLEKAGLQVLVQKGQGIDLRRVLRSLYALGVRRLMVEGGGTLIAGLLRLDLVDELMIYLAPRIFGGASAPTLADGPGFLPARSPALKLISVNKLDDEDGILVHYMIKHKE